MIQDLFDTFTPLADLLTLNELASKYSVEKDLGEQFSIADTANIDRARLISMLIARFGEWRCFMAINSDEDYQNFLKRFAAYFNRYKYYYDEYIGAYATTINMLDGRKTVIAYDTTQSREEGGSDKNAASSNTTSNTNSESQYYDLPRQSTSENRPSSKETDAGKGNSESSSQSETTYGHTDTSKRGGTVTTTGDADVIDLKKRYLQLLQNVYYEFAGRFEPLFVSMFD